MTQRAGVDVGTNSIRLLVLDDDGAPRDRQQRIVRLGQDVDATGRLDDDALARTLDAFRAYRDRWRELGVADGDVRVAATSAVRDAADRDRFLDGVRELAAGVHVEVVDGAREAELALAGVARGLPDAPRPLCVLDVGGGSTELVAGDVDDQLATSISLQLGSVRLTERFLRSDPPTQEQVLAARAEIGARLDEAVEALGDAVRRIGTLVGVAGTATTLGNLVAGGGTWQDGAVHGRTLALDDLVVWSDRLLVAETAHVAAYEEVADGREDVLPAGALIVRRVVERLRRDGLVVSESDGLDGLAAGA